MESKPYYWQSHLHHETWATDLCCCLTKEMILQADLSNITTREHCCIFYVVLENLHSDGILLHHREAVAALLMHKGQAAAVEGRTIFLSCGGFLRYNHAAEWSKVVLALGSACYRLSLFIFFLYGVVYPAWAGIQNLSHYTVMHLNNKIQRDL